MQGLHILIIAETDGLFVKGYLGHYCTYVNNAI